MIESIRNFVYRAKYRYGQHLPLAVPVDVSLELASHCNMGCTYCYHADQEGLPFAKGFMSYATGYKIITQAACLGVNSLKFNWKGESTLNKDFPRLTAYAKKLARGSIFIDRLTNSNFKFDTRKDEIFDGLCNQTKVKVSYDSFSKEVFETQRAGGDHDITTRNIDKFYNYPGRTDTELVIQAVRTKLNQHEDIEARAKKRWRYTTVSIRDMVSGRVEKDLGDLEARRRDPSERQSCLQAHVRLIFSWDGRAHPCCPSIDESLCLGDINKRSLAEIFNGTPAKQLRSMLKDGRAFKMKTCMNCSSFETFKGFRPGWNS